MTHQLLSEIVNDKNIETDISANEKNKYYRQYLVVAESMFDVSLNKKYGVRK